VIGDVAVAVGDVGGGVAAEVADVVGASFHFDFCFCFVGGVIPFDASRFAHSAMERKIYFRIFCDFFRASKRARTRRVTERYRVGALDR